MSLSPEVERRIAEILARLAVLSEVPAASIGHSSPSSDSERQLPPGLYEGHRSPDRPPPKDVSVYDFFAWHLNRARSDQEARVWLLIAEIEIDARTQRPPDQLAAGTFGRSRESAEDRDRRIIEYYEGLDPLQAAIAESAHAGYVSEANVRKVRREGGPDGRYGRRDPETGRKLEGFAGWSDEERTKAVMNLKRQGLGKTKIARELGVSEGTVQRYLGGYRRRVA